MKNQSIAGLICGIASLLLSWVLGLGIVPGIIGLIVSTNTKKKGYESKCITAGIICNTIGIPLSAILAGLEIIGIFFTICMTLLGIVTVANIGMYLYNIGYLQTLWQDIVEAVKLIQ